METYWVKAIIPIFAVWLVGIGYWLGQRQQGAEMNPEHRLLMQRVKELENRMNEDSIPPKVDVHPHVATKFERLYAQVPVLPVEKKKRILVTGGAGFVGSHLVDKLMLEGHDIIVLDNMFTGQKSNIVHWIPHPNFELIIHDVTRSIFLEVDEIYHLACPASPVHYQHNAIKTLKTSILGTLNMLGLARRQQARLLFASTSEVYGDPKVHPQTEDYWGNVNPIGPRSCYDEGKRVSESMCYAYEKREGVNVRVARIFNTFGPRMVFNDGRVVSNFILQALQGKQITLHGDGSQTRSFQYVSDLVDGLVALMESDYGNPVNLGNPREMSIKEIAEIVLLQTQSESSLVLTPAQPDDPKRRRPDITVARDVLGWHPKVSLEEGMEKTIEYFRRELGLLPDEDQPIIWLLK